MVENPRLERNRPGAAGAWGLPAPDHEAQRRSELLCAVLEQDIRSAGSLSFAAYQERVLYDPRLGYYGAGTVRFGAGGDFVTASHSPLFARCLARYYAGLPEADQILEVGAGDAALCRELLPELERLERLPARYRILEPGAALRRRQRKLLDALLAPELRARVSWLKAPPARPFNGLLVALEVLDALPVHCLQWRGGRWRELRVGWVRGRPAWQAAEPGPCLAAAAARLPEPPGGRPEGYRTELRLQLASWLAAISAPLRCGQLLFLDYGYPRHEYCHPQRGEGTLICHYRQRAHFDPFLLPGLQDISASVDFSAVAEAGLECGLEAEGYAEQASWLLACGLPVVLEQVMRRAPVRARLEAARQARWLLLPGETGARFKFMALSRNCPGPAAVWRACDRGLGPCGTAAAERA